MNASTTLEALREFVERFHGVRDLQFDAVPYPLHSHEGISYLLLVASVNQNTSAEHVRDFLAALHKELGDDLLRIHRVPFDQYRTVLEQFRRPEWKLWPHLRRILESAARFIEQVEYHGGFIERSRTFRTAAGTAESIAKRIYFMGRDPTGARKKVWMFMRWMVRPEPDLGVWNPPLSPAELMVPLNGNTGRAFADLRDRTILGRRMRDEGISFAHQGHRLASTAANVEAVTQVARWLFPDDPARVDYAFFCYGRGRYGDGEDAHRCWKIVGCGNCPIRKAVSCPGRR